MSYIASESHDDAGYLHFYLLIHPLQIAMLNRQTERMSMIHFLHTKNMVVYEEFT